MVAIRGNSYVYGIGQVSKYIELKRARFLTSTETSYNYIKGENKSETLA